ncbi:MAG: restriction endonuclease [Ramlibacter sp.]
MFLGQAVALLGLAALLYFVSLVLASSASPKVQAVGQGIRLPIPYVAGIGVLLLVIYALLRPRASMPTEVPPPPPFEPSFVVGGDTSNFDSQIDSRFLDATSPGFMVRPAQRGPAPEWSAQVFNDIEWRRFEAVCELLFAQGGFEARAQSHGADGGVDIWLYSRNAEGPAAVVQCKHWQDRQVGVKEMREFFGVMASHKLKRGSYAATSGFTADALRFARENGINALDGDALLTLIARRTPEQQQALLKVAYEGDYSRPTCASCGIKMVERTNTRDNTTFWGCSQYPRCKFTLAKRGAAAAP